MKYFTVGEIIIGLTFFSMIVVGFISHKFLGDDNIIEEIVEAIIKKKTGLDIDLTPRSKEKKDEPKS